jgi:hypothetical protein
MLSKNEVSSGQDIPKDLRFKYITSSTDFISKDQVTLRVDSSLLTLISKFVLDSDLVLFKFCLLSAFKLAIILDQSLFILVDISKDC